MVADKFRLWFYFKAIDKSNFKTQIRLEFKPNPINCRKTDNKLCNNYFLFNHMSIVITQKPHQLRFDKLTIKI